MKLLGIEVEPIYGVSLGVSYEQEIFLPNDAYVLLDLFFLRFIFEFDRS